MKATLEIRLTRHRPNPGAQAANEAAHKAARAGENRAAARLRMPPGVADPAEFRRFTIEGRDHLAIDEKLASIKRSLKAIGEDGQEFDSYHVELLLRPDGDESARAWGAWRTLTDSQVAAALAVRG